jgi:uroporphyrinogen-III synthase
LVDVVPCYQTVRTAIDDMEILRLRACKPDLLVFTSSSTLRSMLELFGEKDGRQMLLESVVAVIGPVTNNTAESFGKHANILPQENTIASLLEAIRAYFSLEHSAFDRP